MLNLGLFGERKMISLIVTSRVPRASPGTVFVYVCVCCIMLKCVHVSHDSPPSNSSYYNIVLGRIFKDKKTIFTITIRRLRYNAYKVHITLNNKGCFMFQFYNGISKNILEPRNYFTLFFDNNILLLFFPIKTLCLETSIICLIKKSAL